MKHHRPTESWTAPPNAWIEVNVDASRRPSTGTTTIGYVMKDKGGPTTLAEGKQIGDCLILVVECLAIQEALVVAPQ